MPNRFRVCSVVGALVVALVACGSAFAQDKKGAAKVDKAQQAEIAAAIKLVDDVVKGQAAPSDYKFTFTGHPMKGVGARTFMPFMLTFEKGQTLPASAAYYVRVVSRDSTDKAQKAAADHDAAVLKAATAARLDPENAELKAAEEKLRAETPRVEYAFEDYRAVNFSNAKPDAAFMLPSMIMATPGACDAYLLIKDTVASAKGKKVAPKAGLLKVSLGVPNYETPELAVSTLILSRMVQQLNAAPTAAEAARNPYLFGQMAVIPSLDFKFSKSDELTIFFYIYNSGLDAAGKPDVSVEYSFYQKTGDAEKYFNKTPALELNAKTLPPTFDLKAGHQLPGGQSIPLASFPEGEYRLEIKVVDKVAGKTKIENGRFTVTGS